MLGSKRTPGAALACATICGSLLLSMGGVAHAADVIEFTGPPDGINGAGVVVGESRGFQPGCCFLRDPSGGFTYFDSSNPAGTQTYPKGINTAGTVVGFHIDKLNRRHGFVRDTSGNFVVFDVPGGTTIDTLTEARSINDAGAITGSFFDGTATRGFVRNADGSFTKFDAAPGANTQPVGINGAGEIIGYFAYPTDPSHVQQGFLRYATGDVYTFVFSATNNTIPTAINAAGAITGYYFPPIGGPAYGFLRSPRGDFTALGHVLPTSINDAGAITGTVSLGTQTQVFVRDASGNFEAIGLYGSLPTGINTAGTITGKFSNDQDGFVRVLSLVDRFPQILDWLAPPQVTTTITQRLGCLPPPAGPVECFQNNAITTVVSTISGEYGVDVDDDGIRDGALTTNVELLSEWLKNTDGTYSYYWRLTNHGAGPITQFLGGNPAGFPVSTLAPLVGSAGLDLVEGTADDPQSEQFLVAHADSVPRPPRNEAFGVTSPSSGFIGSIVAPTPSTLFDWDAPPSAITTKYQRTGCLPGVEPCTDPRPITGLSCEIQGTYGIDYTGDAVADGTMMGDARLTSEVVQAADGTYTYWWQLANLGSGPANSYLGPNTPGFEISAATPLLNTPIVKTNSSVNPPGSEAWGIIHNPSSGEICTLLKPTPPKFSLNGFYQPVDMPPVINTVKAGSTVPIKFNVFDGPTELTSTSVVKQPLTASQRLCSVGPTDAIEVVATGGTSLRYDTTAKQFIYNWKTPSMPGYCYVVTVTLTDGTSQSASFQLK